MAIYRHGTIYREVGSFQSPTLTVVMCLPELASPMYLCATTIGQHWRRTSWLSPRSISSSNFAADRLDYITEMPVGGGPLSRPP